MQRNAKTLTDTLVKQQVRVLQYFQQRDAKLVLKVLAAEVKQLCLPVVVHDVQLIVILFNFSPYGLLKVTYETGGLQLPQNLQQQRNGQRTLSLISTRDARGDAHA